DPRQARRGRSARPSPCGRRLARRRRRRRSGATRACAAGRSGGPRGGRAGALRAAVPVRSAPGEEEAPPALRRDVRVLGGTLGQILEESGGSGLLEGVERPRRAAIAL